MSMNTRALFGLMLLGCICISPFARAQSVAPAPEGERASDLQRDCLDARHVRDALRRGDLPSSTGDRDISLAMSVGQCEAYIQGYIDGFAFGNYEQADQYRFCIPDGVTRAQVYAVFLRYAETHPERLHWPKSWVLNAALFESFPCSIR